MRIDESNLTTKRMLDLITVDMEDGHMPFYLHSVSRILRYPGARVLISTQELTISLALLDLCSIAIVHHSTSPAWFHALKTYLIALDITKILGNGKRVAEDGFEDIVRLRVGEALCLCPEAIVEAENCRVGM